MPISNTPIWMVQDDPSVGPIPDPLQLLSGVHWDLLVVGAGLVGLLAAFEAARVGLKVAVVEALRVGSGASGRGLGMATVVHGDRNQAIRVALGRDAATECIRWRGDGVRLLQRAVLDLHIACGWTPTTTYVVATTDEGADAVDAEAALLAAAGVATYPSVTDELPFRTAAALAFDGGVHVDPLALCLGLAAGLASRGIPVVEGLRVRAVEEERRGVRLIVDGGSLSADRVVVATRFPIVGPTRLERRLWATRERVVAGVSEPLLGRLRGMYTAVDDGGWSCRPRGGHGDGWTLMAGGARPLRTVTDHRSHAQEVADRAARQLAMSVSRSWSLQEVVSDTGVPIVGPTGRRGRCLVAAGLGQWGPAGAAAAAGLLGQLLEGRSQMVAPLFDPTRQRPMTPRDAVATAVQRLRAPRPARRSDVVSARDDEGNDLSTVSARCSHRGCAIRFDAADQQWECPCHGSRFDPSGAVLDGPATMPLAPVRPVA